VHVSEEHVHSNQPNKRNPQTVWENPDLELSVIAKHCNKVVNLRHVLYHSMYCYKAPLELPERNIFLGSSSVILNKTFKIGQRIVRVTLLTSL